MNKLDVKALADQMIGAVKGYVERATAPILSRLGKVEALEARVKALEQRPSMSYRGVWAEGEENRPGDVCTHDGSMWYCWAATRDRPGTSDAWQLCVKRGRDAR